MSSTTLSTVHFNEVSGNNFIDPSNLGEFIARVEERPEVFHQCDSGLDYCPKCGQKIRYTSKYERTVDHLNEQVHYMVSYYYCDRCSLGWPSIPPGTLPNITLGLDVIGHIAKWHVLDQQSFSTISKHLRECHGIIRDAKTIERNIERFTFFIEDAMSLFDSLVQAYLADQTIKEGLFDETFFDSLYDMKLCLGVLLLPKVRVIAGVNVTDKRNQEYIKETWEEFLRRFGEFDVLGVDLASLYGHPASEVFTSVSLQFCVFHFFQILYRKIINPAARETKKLIKEEVKALKKDIKSEFASLKKAIHGEGLELCQELEKRLNWCLNRRWPNYLVIELNSFRKELVKRCNTIEKEDISLKQSQHDLERFRKGLLEIIDILKGFEERMKHIPELQNFQVLNQHMKLLQEIFKETNEVAFEKKREAFLLKCEQTNNEEVKALEEYFRKYEANLSIYLKKGVEKTTSLLEQMNQRMKKTTKNNRGGHYQFTLQSFAEFFQFFWNTEPLQLKNESREEMRSPISRMSESIASPLPIDPSQPWWSMLGPISYHSYRQRVKKRKQVRSKEFQSLREKKDVTTINSTLSPEQRADQRWQNSQTLKKLSLLFTQSEPPPENPKNIKSVIDGLSTFDKVVYSILISLMEGITRTDLVKMLKVPRSTLYDSLMRLEIVGLVKGLAIKSSKVGRQPVKFFACPIPNG